VGRWATAQTEEIRRYSLVGAMRSKIASLADSYIFYDNHIVIKSIQKQRIQKNEQWSKIHCAGANTKQLAFARRALAANVL
jgi:hypothetical protein